MIKLGIVSDSHWGRGAAERFAQIAERERYDAVIHLGDGASEMRWLQRTLSMPVHAVAGNCDFHADCPRELRMTFGNVRLLAVHGDRYGVKTDYGPLSYYAEEIGAQVALFGHTHTPFAGYAGSVMMLNPGALCDARYAELHIEGGKALPYLKEL